jgi:4-hydroxy-4-methyl-2-oxoglutarate aldolase
MNILDSLRHLSTATIGEAQGNKGIIDAILKPLALSSRLCGPAFPVSIPSGDNLSVHHGLEKAPRGSVLVVQCQNGPTHGFWGEIATIAAMERGIIGLITDGAVRDTDAIRELGFPVFCGGIHIRGTVKKQQGTVGKPIMIGGATIRAGDFIVADSDGIVVVPYENAEATIRSSKARDEKEQHVMAELKKGKTTMEIFGLPAEN